MKKYKVAIISAVLTALMSTMCCLPALIFIIFGVSGGFLTYFTQFDYLRIPLGLISSIFIIYAIIKIFSKKEEDRVCDLKTRKRNIFFVFAVLFLYIFILFYPELIPLFME